MRHLLNFIADFGEAVILVPAALVVALFLALTRQGAALTAWAITLAVAIGVTVVLRTPSIWPSGHVVVSFAFYGGLAVLVWRSLHAGARLFAAALAILVLLFPIAVTGAIWLMRWHGLRGVGLGLIVGCATPIALSLVPIRRDSALRIAAMLLVSALVIVALHGWRLDYTRALAALEAHAPWLSLQR